MRRINRTGWVAVDMIIGLMLLAAVSMALGTTLAKHSQVTQRLADDRAAVRLAERSAMALRAGQPMPMTHDDERVAVEQLGKAEMPDSGKWVRVTATVRGRNARLTALVEGD